MCIPLNGIYNKCASLLQKKCESLLPKKCESLLPSKSVSCQIKLFVFFKRKVHPFCNKFECLLETIAKYKCIPSAKQKCFPSAKQVFSCKKFLQNKSTVQTKKSIRFTKQKCFPSVKKSVPSANQKRRIPSVTQKWDPSAKQNSISRLILTHKQAVVQ